MRAQSESTLLPNCCRCYETLSAWLPWCLHAYKMKTVSLLISENRWSDMGAAASRKWSSGLCSCGNSLGTCKLFHLLSYWIPGSDNKIIFSAKCTGILSENCLTTAMHLFAVCLTCWLPCVTFGRVAEIVDEGNTCKYKKHGRCVITVYHHNRPHIFIVILMLLPSCSMFYSWLRLLSSDDRPIPVALLLCLSGEVALQVWLAGRAMLRLLRAFLLWTLCAVPRTRRARKQRLRSFKR